MTLRAILFDLDLTLVWMDTDLFQRKVARVYEAVAAQYGIDLEKMTKLHRELTIERWTAASTNGVVTSYGGARDGLTISREIWARTLTEFGVEPSGAAAAHDLYWNDRLGIIQPYEETEAVLVRLAPNYKLGVVTNGPHDQQLDKLVVHELHVHFDLILSSGEAGYAKPDRRLFQMALERLEVSAEDALFVGDSLANDVAGAAAAGIQTVWVNRGRAVWPSGGPVPDYEIASLSDLVPIVASIGVSVTTPKDEVDTSAREPDCL